MAGVIKMVMALRHGVLPRTLHVDEPTPARRLGGGRGRAADRAARRGRPGERPRRAGVSSFGVSGTNAHVILEEAPAGGAGRPSARGACPAPAASCPGWCRRRASRRCARRPARLRALVEARPGARPGRTWPTRWRRGRAQLRAPRGRRRRATATALLAGLAALAAGEPAAGVVRGRRGRERPGRRSSSPARARSGRAWRVELLDGSPVFAERMRACDEALAPFVDWSLADVLRGDAGAPALDRVDVVQPALFAVMVSLAALWRSCGVRAGGGGRPLAGRDRGGVRRRRRCRSRTRRGWSRCAAGRWRGWPGRAAMVSVALPAEDG